MLRDTSLNLTAGLEQLAQPPQLADPHPEIDDDEVRELRQVDRLALNAGSWLRHRPSCPARCCAAAMLGRFCPAVKCRVIVDGADRSSAPRPVSAPRCTERATGRPARRRRASTERLERRPSARDSVPYRAALSSPTTSVTTGTQRPPAALYSSTTACGMRPLDGTSIPLAPAHSRSCARSKPRFGFDPSPVAFAPRRRGVERDPPWRRAAAM
jgi:hypothetical protein